MTKTTWILVAHRAGARCYASSGPHHALTLVEQIDHPEGRLRNREIDADAGGRSFDRFGGQRHALESEDSPVEHLAGVFAKELADRLRDGRVAHRYDQLVLVAGPRLLGRLRDALDAPTAALVVKSLDRDVGELSEADLEKYLREHLSL